MQKGPYREFENFDQLKDYLGSAGEGREWHHPVAQHPANVARFGPRAIHNTENILSVDRGVVHQPLNGHYSRKPEDLAVKRCAKTCQGNLLKSNGHMILNNSTRLGSR